MKEEKLRLTWTLHRPHVFACWGGSLWGFMWSHHSSTSHHVAGVPHVLPFAPQKNQAPKEHWSKKSNKPPTHRLPTSQTRPGAWSRVIKDFQRVSSSESSELFSFHRKLFTSATRCDQRRLLPFGGFLPFFSKRGRKDRKKGLGGWFCFLKESWVWKSWGKSLEVYRVVCPVIQ